MAMMYRFITKRIYQRQFGRARGKARERARLAGRGDLRAAVANRRNGGGRARLISSRVRVIAPRRDVGTTSEVN